MAQLIDLRRRRGVARASITRLEKKVTEAEDMKDESGILDRARTLKEKAGTANTEFKKHHVSIIELLDEEYVDAEQGVLDSHEDGSSRFVNLFGMINQCSDPTRQNPNDKGRWEETGTLG